MDLLLQELEDLKKEYQDFLDKWIHDKIGHKKYFEKAMPLRARIQELQNDIEKNF